MTRELVVSCALPYANGPLHLGHLVGYIQGDIWVRAQRLADALPDRAMYERFVAEIGPIAAAYQRNEAATALRLAMALADEANRWIDERKPWVIAKQDGADAELQAVCTQGLNLFRVLAVALKPVLPHVSRRAEEFLRAPVTRWESVAKPLLGTTIERYQPLFTRIDPKQIEAMTEASRESMPAAPSTPAMPTVGIDDFAKLDLRIGKVLACELVEGSDKLLRFELDAGDLGKRQIFSGIRASYGEPGTLVGRNVVFIANLAPRKMRFGVSEGMILSAGFDGGSLALLDADQGARPGMPVR